MGRKGQGGGMGREREGRGGDIFRGPLLFSLIIFSDLGPCYRSVHRSLCWSGGAIL